MGTLADYERFWKEEAQKYFFGRLSGQIKDKPVPLEQLRKLIVNIDEYLAN